MSGFRRVDEVVAAQMSAVDAGMATWLADEGDAEATEFAGTNLHPLFSLLGGTPAHLSLETWFADEDKAAVFSVTTLQSGEQYFTPEYPNGEVDGNSFSSHRFGDIIDNLADMYWEPGSVDAFVEWARSSKPRQFLPIDSSRASAGRISLA